MKESTTQAPNPFKYVEENYVTGERRLRFEYYIIFLFTVFMFTGEETEYISFYLNYILYNSY
jgi:hypothetical protein